MLSATIATIGCEHHATLKCTIDIDIQYCHSSKHHYNYVYNLYKLYTIAINKYGQTSCYWKCTIMCIRHALDLGGNDLYVHAEINMQLCTQSHTHSGSNMHMCPTDKHCL